MGNPRDHPRGCGEQDPAPHLHRRARGPSPRVRGAAVRVGLGEVAGGTIPAGAGSSRPGHYRPGCDRDHPRGCGEQRTPPFAQLRARGPSPRVRGAAPERVDADLRDGTIPAGAGSRRRWRPGAAPSRDHPRGCGEQTSWRHRGAMPQGPSPRVRGAGGAARRTQRLGGTIPAGAGSRSGRYTAVYPVRDHPRGCGEQALREIGAVTAEGPSPRVWGAAVLVLAERHVLGTIPAGAGSSDGWYVTTHRARDHPRGCGEQIVPYSWRLGEAGPSPRVRGAVPCRRRPCRRSGTIPAGAGSSAGVRHGLGHVGDHPRGCGEQAQRLAGLDGVQGPSPRVRGAVGVELRSPPEGGPSPRVRGAGWPSRLLAGGAGTIPAGAGSSGWCPPWRSCTGDHPRGCGEQLGGVGHRVVEVGPSPRVRGADLLTCGFIAAGTRFQ